MVAGAACRRRRLSGAFAFSVALLSVMLVSTDAALGPRIVADRLVPARVRQALNVESGLNDGLAVPFFLVLVDVSLAQLTARATTVWRPWSNGPPARSAGASPPVVVASAFVGGALVRWRRPARLDGEPVAADVDAGDGDHRLRGGPGARRQRLHRRLRRRPRPSGGRPAPQTRASCSSPRTPADCSPPSPGSGSARWRSARCSASLHLAGRALRAVSLTVVRLVPVALAMLRSHARRRRAFLGWFGPRGLASIVFALIALDDHVPDGQLLLHGRDLYGRAQRGRPWPHVGAAGGRLPSLVCRARRTAARRRRGGARRGAAVPQAAHAQPAGLKRS